MSGAEGRTTLAPIKLVFPGAAGLRGKETRGLGGGRSWGGGLCKNKWSEFVRAGGPGLPLGASAGREPGGLGL